MKKVILLVLLLPSPAIGQIIQNFETAGLSGWVQGTDGHWKADTAGALSGLFSLHHVFDNPSNGSDCIGITESDLHPAEGTAKWSFIVRHGCDPSSSNNWFVSLMSDISPGPTGASTSFSGFAAGINLTGFDDTLRLWKIRNGTQSVVATAPLNWQNDIGTGSAAKIVVERSVAGSWTIKAYDLRNNMLARGSGSDTELFSPAFFTINYRYTSLRDRLLWIDDVQIEGVFYKDILPPEVTGWKVSSIKNVDIFINEDPSPDFISVSNFSLGEDSVAPSAVERRGPGIYRLTFSKPFVNKKTVRLFIVKMCDITGNCTMGKVVSFTPVWADPGDVIISEIMADPVPSVSLPEKEYLEIFNRSEFPVQLKKWTLNITGQSAQFPDIGIGPGQYMILCQEGDTADFSSFGKCTGMKSFPMLTDGGRAVWISDSLGNLIHGVEYSPLWYGEKLKSTGGWSLEMIDTSYPFYESGNWEASSSLSGGTPGKINSGSRTNTDNSFDGIKNVFPSDERTIKLRLSESTFNLSSAGKIEINGSAAEVTGVDPLLKSFIVKSPFELFPGQVYTLDIDRVTEDIAGNRISVSSSRFGMPVEAVTGSIVFNELLFDPLPGEPEYIELYNLSDNTADASRLQFATINSATGDTSAIKQVMAEERCILPHSFFTVTTDGHMVARRYSVSDPLSIFDTPTLPSLPDDKGHIILLTRSLIKIDEAVYTSAMHSPLLSVTEGISLEKIRPELNSMESSSWHSASGSSGWGTPGSENSVFEGSQMNADRVVLSASSISPDNDGNDDALVIDINAEGLGNVISVTLFDENGWLVRKLRENLFAGNKASVVWDATASDGSLVPAGIYIILIELYNDKGKTRSWKKVCTVMR